jgi:hypothetical protein
MQAMLLCPCIIHQFTQTRDQRSANESTPRAITMQRNRHSPIFLEQRHCRPLCDPTGREWRPSEEVAFAPRGRCGYLSPCTEDAFIRYQFQRLSGGSVTPRYRCLEACERCRAPMTHWPVRSRVQGSDRSGPPPDSLPPASMLRGSRGHAIVTIQADGIVWCSWIPWCH